MVLAFAAPLAFAAADETPILTNRGYALYQAELAQRLGEYEVDGRRAPLAECVQAGPRCREIVECSWSLAKVEPDPSDVELPLSCVTLVAPDPAIRIRSPETVCSQIDLGGSATFAGRVATPLHDSPHWFRLTLRVDLRDLAEQRVEQIAVAQQLWRLEARAEEPSHGLWEWLPGLAIALCAAVVILLLSRPTRRPVGATAETRRGAPRARAVAPSPPPGPAVLASPEMNLDVYPAELLADGRSTARVVVQLSRGGAPVPDRTIEFSGDEPGAALRFNPTTATTDVEGFARADYTMPRGSTLARLALTAEATVEGNRRLSRTRSIRVAQPRLTVRPQRATLPPPDAAPWTFRASLASNRGNPMPDIELLAEVVIPGTGTVDPPHRRTDAQGAVVFRYSSGRRPSPSTIRIWPAGCPEAAVEVAIESV